MRYRYRRSTYLITVRQITGAKAPVKVTVDGIPQRDGAIPLVDDGAEHRVDVELRRQMTALLEQVA